MNSTCKMFNDVAAFHEQIVMDFAEGSPSLVSEAYCKERFEFMLEEVSEFHNAYQSGDIVGVADALADTVYVALGTAYRMGLPWDKIWHAVQSANMRKVRGTTKRGNAVDAAKPPGWVGPETEIARAIGSRLDGTPES